MYPADVLGEVKGRTFTDHELARIFAPLLTSRRVDQRGYVRFRNWRLYSERGLSGEPASIWITDEDVTIQAADDPLATYEVRYQPRPQHLVVDIFAEPQDVVCVSFSSEYFSSLLEIMSSSLQVG